MEEENTSLWAWQGWGLDVPADWAPVRLEGNQDRGSAILADIEHKRLELRWRKPRRGFDPSAAMREEVGVLAANEAVRPRLQRWPESLLYVDPRPPGRDVWIGSGSVSGRSLMIVHHAQRRDLRFIGEILPSLHDQPPDGPIIWSAFTLHCTAPPGFALLSHRLNVGDLALTFGRRGAMLGIREIAVASLALRRMPIRQWLADHQRQRSFQYRAAPAAEGSTWRSNGRAIEGVLSRSIRRRRYGLMRSLPPVLHVCCFHDADRDKLVFVESHDPAMLETVAASVGRSAAKEGQPCRP